MAIGAVGIYFWTGNKSKNQIGKLPSASEENHVLHPPKMTTDIVGWAQNFDDQFFNTEWTPASWQDGRVTYAKYKFQKSPDNSGTIFSRGLDAKWEEIKGTWIESPTSDQRTIKMGDVRTVFPADLAFESNKFLYLFGKENGLVTGIFSYTLSEDHKTVKANKLNLARVVEHLFF